MFRASYRCFRSVCFVLCFVESSGFSLLTNSWKFMSLLLLPHNAVRRMMDNVMVCNCLLLQILDSCDTNLMNGEIVCGTLYFNQEYVKQL